MSVHSFDTDVAAMVGVPAATIAYNIAHWCEKNAANGAHFHEDRHWTYNSVSAFKELFPYLSAKQIRTALNKLESAGLIVSGNFNKQGRDRTKWYSFVAEAVVKSANCPKGQMQLPKKASPVAQKGKPLPDSKPDNKPIANAIVSAQDAPTPPKAKKVTKRGSRMSEAWAPTPTDYAHASKNGLTSQEINHEADQFRDYHVAKGTISKDWSASWRTWCRNTVKWKSERKQQRARPGRRQHTPDTSAFIRGIEEAADILDHATLSGRDRQEFHSARSYSASAHERGDPITIDVDSHVVTAKLAS
ncbi:MAG: hypothetical protein HRT63_09610 [Erythrobacter sp.]|nr:hypothetical protein [Erythrobacter sp.]